MQSVLFVKPWSAYSPGDIAGFDDKRAEALVKAGAAKPYSPDASNAEGESDVQQPAADALPEGGAQAPESAPQSPARNAKK
jgi:hypothetical protein